MLNIAVCSSGEIYGGVEEWIYTFCHYRFSDKKFDIKIVLFYEGKLAEKLREIGISPIVIGGWKYNPFLFFKLYKIFRENKINIVHTHGYKADIIASLPAKILKLRLIKTEHGDLEPEKWYSLSSLKMRVNIFIDRIFENLFDNIVFVTKDLQDRRGVKKKKSWHIIHNSIRDVAVNGDKVSELAELKGESFVVGIVGRISPVKGHIYLLKAVENLSKSIPNLKLWVLGDGILRPELEKYCRDKKLDKVVSFFGFQADVYDYMSNFDIFAIPSLHEGLPYTLLEAAYLEIPVIASGVGGMKEVMENELDIIFVPPCDSFAIERAILRLYCDRNLSRTVASNAKKKIDERFMAHRMVEKYIAIYLGKKS